jgi:hypothetical protein
VKVVSSAKGCRNSDWTRIFNVEHLQVSETGFAAGTDHLTLADLTFMCNFSSLVETNLYPELFNDFPELKTW